MKQISILLIFFLFFSLPINANDELDFLKWKNEFKVVAMESDISESTFDLVMKDARFLPKVIEYDRYQPEFYEDTKTYITKRTSKKKIKSGIDFYEKNSDLIDEVEKKI